MCDNTYYGKLNRFRDLLAEQVSELFSEYGNKLTLTLGGYKLLQRKGNCIESSTAMGYLLEEFLVSNLEERSLSRQCNGFELFSYSDGTSKRSSDCYAIFEGIKVLINIKTEKSSSVNYAVAAIKQLENDYRTESKTELAYLILKIKFDYINTSSERQIQIEDNLSLLYLEECDYSQYHRQDHRSWSDNDTKTSSRGNSGRLVLSPAFIRAHKMPEYAISYELTKKQLFFLNTKEGCKSNYIMPQEAWPKYSSEPDSL